jgi:gas vesicle protein
METAEQTQFREHVRLLRQAAHGIGHDVKVNFSNLDDKIERLGKMTKKEAKYAILDLEDDLANAGRTINSELKKVPGAVSSGAVAAGTAIQNGVVGGATAAREAIVEAGSRTKEASKNTFARLAGVNRKPMKEWKNP